MKISQVQQNQGLNLSNMPDLLAKLKVGDAVRAKILDFTANELILKLFDGETVTAATTSPIDANRGDIIDFTVKGKNDSQIILEPSKNQLKTENNADLSIKRQMLALELKPEEKNLEIAKEISKYNLPFNKETFQTMTELLTKFKSLTPEKAAFLTAGNIQIEEKSIDSLHQLISGKAKISAGITDLTDSLLKVEDQDVIKTIAEQLADSIPSRFEENIGKRTEISINEALNQQQGASVSEESKNNVIEKTILEFADTIEKDFAQKDISKYSQNQWKDIKESIIKLVNASPKMPEKLSSDLQKLFMDKIGGTELPEKIKSEINLFIDKLKTKLKEKQQGQDERIVMTGDIKPDDSDSKAVLKKVIQKMFIKPESETLKEDINAKRLYKDISRVIEVIKENMDKSSVSNKKEIISKIETLDNNLRFINELNNHSTYVQIPINMRDTNTQGELYILKKESKRKKIDPENVTMFISLDTVNIGRVDSLIKLDRKNVSIHMRVEDQRVFDLIKEKYKDLYEVLKENGYKLVNLNYRLIEETPNIMNVESIVKKEEDRNRQSIDLRL